MGVAGIVKLLSQKLGELPSAIIATVACLFVPIQMAGQTWDDHDRSGRYTCRDIGQNYLNSCQKKGNPIIFTNGDNDTFPLWYNQETEGFRTDMRVCNLSYLQTDWYIDQMKRPAYSSPSVPITWSRLEYVSGTNEYVQVRPEVKETILALYKSNPADAKKNFGENPFELKNILKYWVRSNNKDLQCIPTDSIVIKLDKEAIKRSGMMIPDSLHGVIPDYMTLSLKGKRGVTKAELMMLEMIAQCNWERPVYMAISVGTENQLCFADNFCQEGLAYRITPFSTSKVGGRIDSEKMYDNIMHKFKWGGMDNPKVYLDENQMRMCYSHRRLFAQLATQLVKEGKKDKALKALDYGMKVIPTNCIPHDFQSGSMDMAQAYFDLGQKQKAEQIVKDLATKSYQYVNWYLSLSNEKLAVSNQNCVYNLYILDEMNKMLKVKQSSLLKEYKKKFEALYAAYSMRTGAK